MAQNFSNVMDYKVVANNGFQFNVNVYGVNNLGNRKWMLRAVEVIRDYFTFADGADEGLIVNVVVNTHEIIVKAEFNGKKYFALPIQPRYGKNQIKGILDNMGVVKDVIDVYTNNMVNNNEMEDNDMVDMVNNIDMFNGYIMDDVLVKDFYYAVESAEVFANEYGDTFAENEHICGDFDYDYDIRQMWADWCWENDVMSRDDAYKYYDSNRDMFICEDDLDDIVEGFDGTEDVGDGECLVWVKNPYYVEQEQVENESPYLDDVERVVKVIKDYVINYEGMLMDYDGNSASICVPWDVFDEDDMKMLIEDGDMYKCVGYALMVDGVPLREILVYDDGVYVSVDAKMFDNVA